MDAAAREQHRDFLRAAGFVFCEDSKQKLDPTLKQAGTGVTLRQAANEHREGATGRLHHLLRNGVTASSCDHDVHQNIGMNLCCWFLNLQGIYKTSF